MSNSLKTSSPELSHVLSRDCSESFSQASRSESEPATVVSMVTTTRLFRQRERLRQHKFAVFVDGLDSSYHGANLSVGRDIGKPCSWFLRNKGSGETGHASGCRQMLWY